VVQSSGAVYVKENKIAGRALPSFEVPVFCLGGWRVSELIPIWVSQGSWLLMIGAELIIDAISEVRSTELVCPARLRFDLVIEQTLQRVGNPAHAARRTTGGRP